MEVPAGTRLVAVSGQLGVGADDGVPEDVGAQAELCFANIAAILAEAGMSLADIVTRSTPMSRTGCTCGPTWMCATGCFRDPAPASTLMIVSGFARPEFKVEIEAIAAG